MKRARLASAANDNDGRCEAFLARRRLLLSLTALAALMSGLLSGGSQHIGSSILILFLCGTALSSARAIQAGRRAADAAIDRQIIRLAASLNVRTDTGSSRS